MGDPKPVSDQKPKTDLSFAKTPLGIIGLFITFTEVALTVGVIQTTGGVQLALTSFVLAFPLFVASAFFFILWHRPGYFTHLKRMDPRRMWQHTSSPLGRSMFTLPQPKL